MSAKWFLVTLPILLIAIILIMIIGFYFLWKRRRAERADMDYEQQSMKKSTKGKKKQSEEKKTTAEKPLTRKYERANYDDDVTYDVVAGWRIKETTVPNEDIARPQATGEGNQPKFLYETFLEDVKKKKDDKKKRKHERLGLADQACESAPELGDKIEDSTDLLRKKGKPSPLDQLTLRSGTVPDLSPGKDSEDSG